MTRKTEPNVDFEEEENSLNDFGKMMLVLEVVLIVLLWIFARDQLVSPTDPLMSQRYPAYQDVNVMMLVGFAFLMTFIRSYAWSSIAYTFFLNAYIFQIYILLSGFWNNVWNGGWGHNISVDVTTMIGCSYAVASVLVAAGGVIGRCGPKDLLIIMTFQIIGYSLNEKILFQAIGMIDGGCSSTIHIYGAYYGLGGIWSAIIVAFYNTGFDAQIEAMYSNGHFLFPPSNSFLKQGGLQIAGTFCSLGMAIAFVVLGGLVTSGSTRKSPSTSTWTLSTLKTPTSEKSTKTTPEKMRISTKKNPKKLSTRQSLRKE